ncbi:MAG: chromosome segregation protein SMC [Anaerolineales bacterium]|jgi:chromosome segregation protein
MPLRLKSLELHGYKTFAGKTTFEFAEGITAIVGPNGSGKSNIADAIRWVLGEQTYSLLRAKKTEDMIFAGSEQRPRAGMAAAVVTFDNSTGWLPVDFSEVALGRRAYRDGRNDYVINSQQVRLKDINELLAQSGLSERTYTILGQGLVDASLALKADERRRLFEEAAGIGLYRSRREEALHRLDATQRNLDRVLDILAELEPRLKSLERQAARAQEYTRVQTDLRELLRQWYGFHWHRAQYELTSSLEAARSQETKLVEAQAAYQTIRQNFVAFRERLNGLRSRLNSWHRQSAQLHDSRETINRDLAVLEERQRSLMETRRSLEMEHSRVDEELRIAIDRRADSAEETARLQKEYDEAQTQVKTAQVAFNERQEQRVQVEQGLEEIRRRQAELGARQAQLQACLDELASRAGTQKMRMVSLQQSCAAAELRAQEAAMEYQQALAIRQNAESAFQKAEAGLKTAQKRLAFLENEHKEKQSDRSAKEAVQARFKAQLDVLDQAEQSLSGYAEGAKLLLEAARKSQLDGARGALSSALDVPAELEVAIAAALGEYTDAILLESGTRTEAALAVLDADPTSRASLLPLDWLTPAEPLMALQDPECLGVAADLVKAPAELRPAVDLLLGQVLVVRHREAARRVLAGQNRNVKAVTLHGEVFHASGQVLAGKPATGALGRHRQRREVQDSLREGEGQIALLDSGLLKLAGQIEGAHAELSVRETDLDHERTGLESARTSEQQAQVQADATRRELEWQVGQRQGLASEIDEATLEQNRAAAALSEIEKEALRSEQEARLQTTALADLSQEEFQEQVTYWSMQAAVAERALSDALSRHGERDQAITILQTERSESESRLNETDRSLKILETEREGLRGRSGSLNKQLDELRILIEPAEKELETAEEQEIDLQEQEAESQLVLARFERNHNQFQLELGRKQESLENLRQKIEDDFGLVAFEYSKDVAGPVPLPFDGMVEQLPVVSELPLDLEENLSRQKALLRRMGLVNPEAQQEFLTVKDRHTFLTSQLEDLRKAEADLRQVIAELDELTRREFRKTFDSVAQEFHTIFHRLFGGGSARLLLTDPDNLTETGIDIEARLPGRREQGLSLLSGGERSLTAIALVFALLKISPTPVCVMDEVDAMLDEANVGRFRDMLLELSRETQFIIITHNRNTVQSADVIYGVTMGRDSTSQVISLKLDQISETYLK